MKNAPPNPSEGCIKAEAKMKDQGLVVAIKNNFAQVHVETQEACCRCSARSVCASQKDGARLLLVRNPLQAEAGDTVIIDVPEINYYRKLTSVFGFLLGLSLLGLGLGCLTARLFSLPASLSSFLGLMAGLVLGGFLMVVFFRKQNQESLYPVITEILKKGELYG